MNRIHGIMDALFDRAYSQMFQPVLDTVDGDHTIEESIRYRLPIEVAETDAAFSIVAHLPGVHVDEVSIQADGDILTIEAYIPGNPPDSTDQRTLISELNHGKMRRRITLKNVDIDKIDSELTNGVLYINLPKISTRVTKQIPVHSGHTHRLEASMEDGEHKEEWVKKDSVDNES